MSAIERLVLEHRMVAEVALRQGDDALRLWYADLGVELLENDQVGYYCPHCGRSAVLHTHEFVYSETSHCLRCDTCRGYADERGGALD